MIELLQATQKEMGYLESGNGSKDQCRECSMSSLMPELICSYSKICRFFVKENSVCDFYKLDPFKAIEDWEISDNWEETKQDELFKFKICYGYAFPDEKDSKIRIETRIMPNSFWKEYTFFWINEQEIIVDNSSWSGRYVYDGINTVQMVFSYVLGRLRNIRDKEKQIYQMMNLPVPPQKKERIYLNI